MIKKKKCTWLYIIVLLGFMISCSKAPDIPFEQVITTSNEIDLGTELDKLMMKGSVPNGPGPVLDTFGYHNTYTYLKSIQDTLLQTNFFTNTTVFPWTIRVIKNDTLLNAFCLPGGFIYIYTGLFKKMENEAQAAGLIAHLMTHTDSHHTTEVLSSIFGIDFILNCLTSSGSQNLTEIAEAFYKNQIIYSSQENYTDTQSVKCLYNTKYDAYAIHDLFSKLLLLPKVDFLITNPSYSDRLSKIASEFNSLGGVHGQLFANEYLQFLATLP